MPGRAAVGVAVAAAACGVYLLLESLPTEGLRALRERDKLKHQRRSPAATATPQPPPPPTPPPTQQKYFFADAVNAAKEALPVFREAPSPKIAPGIGVSQLRLLLEAQIRVWASTGQLDPTACDQPPFTTGVQSGVRVDGKRFNLEPLVWYPNPWQCKARAGKWWNPDGTPICSRKGKPHKCPPNVKAQVYSSGLGCKPARGWGHTGDQRWERLRAATAILRMQCTRSLSKLHPAAKKAPRRVYIDLGARTPPRVGRPAFDWHDEVVGQIPELGSNGPQFPLRFTHVHAFEMATTFADQWRSRLANDSSFCDGAEVTFHHAAATTADGKQYYSYNPSNPNTMDKVMTERECSVAHCKEVTSVDVGAWIRRTVTPEDWVVLKMDVEGFEYKLLPHLYNTGVLHDLVDELFVEMHDAATHVHLRSLDKRQTLCKTQGCSVQMLAALRMQGIAAHDWV
eukprot:TRINITY_DN44023_c0_g1_i1.p1 TRINITY_DN44023_c0_g1~~TRINITY_DN44023_c0_g1_i1.p1  ORF type:complete len:475 (+),score=76.66 TRINITY_DN44023_c0_g1_i1:62-1426(+)